MHVLYALSRQTQTGWMKAPHIRRFASDGQVSWSEDIPEPGRWDAKILPFADGFLATWINHENRLLRVWHYASTGILLKTRSVTLAPHTDYVTLECAEIDGDGRVWLGLMGESEAEERAFAQLAIVDLGLQTASILDVDWQTSSVQWGPTALAPNPDGTLSLVLLAEEPSNRGSVQVTYLTRGILR